MTGRAHTAAVVALLAVVSACADHPAGSDPDDPTQPPVAGDRLVPTDFTYVGAFKLPAESVGGSSFGYGGTGLAYDPTGDAAGSPDGFPGALFIGGHPYQQFVAQVDIPAPVIPVGGDVSTLPTAAFVQPFADPTGGLGPTLADEHRLGGLLWLDHPATGGPKLHWTVWRWYNVAGENVLGHGWSNPDLHTPGPAGGWRLRGFHNQLTAGYLFDAPQPWADEHLGGRVLISGQNNVPGNATSSWGPAMFAYAPWLEGSPPPRSTELDALPLVYYPFDPAAGARHFPEHHHADKWGGGAWVTGSSGSAAIIVGRKALGPERYESGGPTDCNGDKGYHGEPYQPQMLFYDVEALARSAAGDVQPWEILPYEAWPLTDVLLPTCDGYINGAAYDRATRTLFLIQPGADLVTNEYEPLPVVHVFRVR